MVEIGYKSKKPDALTLPRDFNAPENPLYAALIESRFNDDCENLDRPVTRHHVETEYGQSLRRLTKRQPSD